MYTEDNLLEIDKQLKKRYMLCALPAAGFVLFLVFSLVIRIEWLSYLASISLCFFIIFAWGVFISPINSYKKFLRNMLYAKNRTVQGRFKGFINSPAKRDGVIFTPFYINVGETDDEEDERLFYYDSNMPLPNWSDNDLISITSHDKSVVKWESLDA